MSKMILKKALLLAWLLTLVLSARVYSVEITDLYQVKLEVSDQSSKSRWAATLSGFKEVLVRNSGDQKILSTQETLRSYSKVTSYLQRYEYSSGLNAEGDKTIELLLDFNPILIDNLIKKAGMTLWGSNRPLTILWLAYEQDFERKIIKDEEGANTLSFEVKKNATRRGVPIILPLMDLEDQLNITTSDIWGRFSAPILQASKRYAADSVISGRISLEEDQWLAKMSYQNDAAHKQTELTAATPAEIIAAIVDWQASQLCEKYCVVEAGQTSRFIMQISNISSFAQFRSVQKYLHELSSIKAAEISQVSGKNVRFSLSLLGDIDAVRKAITLSNRLVEEEPPLINPFSADNAGVLDVTEATAESINQDGEFQPSLNSNPLDEGADKPVDNSAQPSDVFYFRWQE